MRSYIKVNEAEQLLFGGTISRPEWSASSQPGGIWKAKSRPPKASFVAWLNLTNFLVSRAVDGTDLSVEIWYHRGDVDENLIFTYNASDLRNFLAIAFPSVPYVEHPKD